MTAAERLIEPNKKTTSEARVTVTHPQRTPSTIGAIVNRETAPLAVERIKVPISERTASQALVEVDAFSVNRGELALLASRPDGWRPGQDLAGRVIVPAGDGTGPQAGQRIVGLVEEAGWATHVPIASDRLAVLPDHVKTPAAATLGLAGLTALRILRLGGPLLGRRVLITGAAGSVGRLAIQLAALQGAHVTAIATQHEDELRSLGAEEVLPNVDPGQRPHELILENLGGESLTQAIAASAPRATIVVYGTTSGEPTPLTIYDFIGHEDVRLQTYFSYAHPDPPAGDLELLVSLLARGRLTAPIGRILPWTELDAGLHAFQHREFSGKLVLTVP